MQKLVVHIPRWLRWGLFGFLLILAVGFSALFFLGMGRNDYGSWIQPSVSIVQIAMTGLAYVTLLFFTESSQSASVLKAKSDAVLTKLLPECFNRITDINHCRVRTHVGAPSGVVGRSFDLYTDDTRVRLWVGLNVHRVIVIYFCELPSQDAGAEFREQLLSVFAPTINGALAVGYKGPSIQFETVKGHRLASLWLTWNLADANSHDDFLTHTPTQLFFAQDVALMTQSFLRTAQRQGIRLATPIEPMPL